MKVVVITGIGSGVGRATARLFAREGAHVVGGDLREDWAKETLRLIDEDGTLVLPGSFIPAAERYNLMGQIDRWVIDKTLQYLAKEIRSEDNFVVFINLSGTSISTDGLIGYIREKINQYQVPAQQLCFEITETAAIASYSQANRFINALKELGCKFALDDFGSGYSSLAYFKNIPASELKIDKSFITNMLENQANQHIVTSIINMAQGFGLKVVAEGVEDRETYDKLQ